MNKKLKERNIAHISRYNMILSTLILVLLSNILIQIWLLYTSLNNALDGEIDVAITCFIVSFILLLVAIFWLKLLPKYKGEFK